LYPALGDIPMKRFQGKEGRLLVKRVQRELAQTELAKSTRRQILQNANRLLNLAVEPFELIDANPLPRGFLPTSKSPPLTAFVYPSEDAALMKCVRVPLIERLFYGVLIREGLRVSEALNLTWSSLDLEHGVLSLDENKTDDPRDWSLDPGVRAALRIWKKLAAKGHSANKKVFVRADGRTLDRYEAAARLREYLQEAGVTRAQLFERSGSRLALRAHDLRASFVTISLGIGRSESWVTDRTGHQSSAMVYKYKRQVSLHQELKLGPLTPLDEAIPELAAAVARATP
jgi:integrase